jgi:hypothetical protein
VDVLLNVANKVVEGDQRIRNVRAVEATVVETVGMLQCEVRFFKTIAVQYRRRWCVEVGLMQLQEKWRRSRQ